MNEKFEFLLMFFADAVVVTLFKVVTGVAEDPDASKNVGSTVGMGLAIFIWVNIGALLIGFLVGCATALITRFTRKARGKV